MARLRLSEKEAKEILQKPKIAKGDVKWISKPNKSWVTSELDVESDIKGKLTLRLNVNIKEHSFYSYGLFLNSIFRICGLDVNGSHTNKCTDGKKFVLKTHKNIWSDKCGGGDAHAYVPGDIDTSTHEQAFRDFCRECNIDFQGKFSALPPQQLQMKGML